MGAVSHAMYTFMLCSQSRSQLLVSRKFSCSVIIQIADHVQGTLVISFILLTQRTVWLAVAAEPSADYKRLPV